MVTVALVCLSNTRRIPQQTIRTVQFTARNGFCNLTQAKLTHTKQNASYFTNCLATKDETLRMPQILHKFTKR